MEVTEEMLSSLFWKVCEIYTRTGTFFFFFGELTVQHRVELETWQRISWGWSWRMEDTSHR
jgi:hypothetical protein